MITDVVSFINSGQMPVDPDNEYEGWADIVGAVHPETVEKIWADSMDIRNFEDDRVIF